MSTISPPMIQQPSTLWVPDRSGSYGPEIKQFADNHGISMDPEQERDVDCLASFGPRGRWLTYEVCIIEGRQNGKTKREIMPIVLTDFFVLMLEPDQIIWTAHLMSTTLDTFNEVVRMIESYSDLSKRVKHINTEKTAEGIELLPPRSRTNQKGVRSATAGAELNFRARAGGGGRGLSGVRLVYDEALFLKAENMGATMPVLSSRDNPQIMYGSSPGKATSTQLHALQKRGRRLNDPSLIFIEYKSPGGWEDPGCALGLKCDHIHDNPLNIVEMCGCGMRGNHTHGPEDFVPTGEFHGCAMDNRENWKMANHAINAGRMHLSVIDAESRALRQTFEGVLEFGRERMGWSEADGDEIDPDKISSADWEVQTDPNSEIVGQVCFAVDMNPAGSHVSIAVAGLRPDGQIHFGVIAYGRGSSWAPRRLRELTETHETLCPVYWVPTSPVGALKREFARESVKLHDVTDQEYCSACGAMKAHITNGTAWHTGSEILDTAFKSSKRVVLPEGGWKFGRRKSMGDVSPMASSALAIMGADEHAYRVPGVWEV